MNADQLAPLSGLNPCGQSVRPLTDCRAGAVLVSINDRSQKSERTMIAAFIKASGAAIQGPGGCMVV
jgi:hypothetical protein